MPRRAAPSMPTERQVKKVHKVVLELCPKARIKRVGPDGVIFDYPDGEKYNEWQDKPFTAETEAK